MTAVRRHTNKAASNTEPKNKMRPYTLNAPGSAPAPTAEEAQANSFFAVLQRKELQNGTIAEINKKLGEAAIAATRTGKKASVTIQLNIAPTQGALNITTKLSSKVPQDEENICIFYCTPEGELTRNDPNQREFELTTHSGGKDAEHPERVAVAN